MPLRFYRRVRLLPGARINLSKRGASVSVGRRRSMAHYGPRQDALARVAVAARRRRGAVPPVREVIFESRGRREEGYRPMSEQLTNKQIVMRISSAIIVGVLVYFIAHVIWNG
jgi:Protein of unknown function (DUF4236)